MAIGSKDLNMENLAALDTGALTDQLRTSKEELFNLRFQAATGQLESNGRLKSVKRDIARIYTVLRERELGIREDVAPAAEKTEKKASKKAAKSEDDAK
ncbi:MULTISPECIES: 50S ribosomal protein L29 [Kocuria]|uniref:Large ribosomal subunit protein uL29 n=1 Tax=Kocuria marina subsp. indica TaxID=1049583 RepID=A0A1X7CLC7_9MICC|nr:MULTISPECIES: 50S ribosomal protein L29 [Kocuria]MCG7431242.1 50S ribosomal protein L29 [Kocuria indica]OXS84267.1 50S ribosomal protein L29 [Kocuria indica]QIR69225.1 50S ribosomal protein L29 [Kocuria sp. KD4]RLP58642.1 50S ribosomal protein L29 [Kocuria indica]SME98741.1 LSU ribosomal protein L29P [Kocuria indica]